MKRKFILGVLALGMLSACGNSSINESTSDSSKKEEQLSVVTTNSILSDMVKEIGGDEVAIHSIVPIGTDPHEHEVLPEDIKKASDADVIFYNGLNLETGGNGWFVKLMETTNKKEGTDYFSVSKAVEPLYLEGKTDASSMDPHAWLDITNGIRYVDEITEVLSKKDPDNASTYQKNEEAYVKKLQELHNEALSEFADIPQSQKLLVTSEGAFKYFSKAYGLEAAYIWEINTESQGTPDQMKQIVDKVKSSEVPVLFVETSVDHRSMERVAKETGKEIYSEIYTDSIGKPGSNGDSYFNMMKWNLDQIHEGLAGKSKTDK